MKNNKNDTRRVRKSTKQFIGTCDKLITFYNNVITIENRNPFQKIERNIGVHVNVNTQLNN